MQKNAFRLEILPYEAELFPDETKKAYANMKAKTEGDPILKEFRRLLGSAEKESLLFLERLGLDVEKISSVRLLSQPDEKGEVLFLCNARLCGRLLRGGETTPRQSVEEAGISMVFVGQEKDFLPSTEAVPAPQVEMRFVLPLIYTEETESKE